MRNVSLFVLIAAWAGTGCFTMPTLWGDPKQPPLPPAPPAVAEPAKPAPRITADEITDMNAREKAAQLLQELEHEPSGDPAKPAPAKKVP
jgi:hypothetical protein